YWLATTQLYRVFDQHRHAVVHRRTGLEANGDLTGTDSLGSPLSAISVAEQDALSRHAATLGDVLIQASTSKRLLNAIAWDHNILESRHGCGVLAATQPPTVIVKVIDDMRP